MASPTNRDRVRACCLQAGALILFVAMDHVPLAFRRRAIFLALQVAADRVERDRDAARVLESLQTAEDFSPMDLPRTKS